MAQNIHHYTFDVYTPPPAQEGRTFKDDFPYLAEYTREFSEHNHPTSPRQRGGR